MAKFKVGDRVKYKGGHPKIRGKSGTVSFVGIPGDDPTYLTVDMDNGEEWGAPEKDWVLSNSRACNGVRSTNAVVAKALNACARNENVRNADVVPPDLWEKLKRTSLAYVVAGELKNGKGVDELIARFRKSGPGSQIPGRAQDSAIAASVLEEMKRRGINACGTARNSESEQREIVEMNIDSLKKDLDKVVRGLDETKRWMGKYGDNRIASIDKAKGAVVQAIQQLKY